MTQIKDHHELTPHDHHNHTEHHSHDHHQEPDHQDTHNHTSPHRLWYRIASALHLPGYTHDHGSISEEGVFFENELAIRTVKLALFALAVTTCIQFVIYFASGSVALLGDTVHNLGDALNSIPLWIAFVLARRSANKRYTYGYGRAEDIAGVLIVVSIAFSAAYILWESFQKLINPQPITHLGWVALAAVVGFVGNEIVASLQIRVGRKIGSAAMIADGLHARTDGLTSLAVLGAAVGVALGFPILDPLIGLLIGVTIVFITRSTAISMWHRLMDAVDPALVEATRSKILEHEEVKSVHRLQLRYVGHRLLGEILIAVDAMSPIGGTELLTDHLRHELYHLLPSLADVTIEVVGWQPDTMHYHKESAHHREMVQESV